MTPKEAFKVLKNTLASIRIGHVQYTKALHLAMAALQKQIPKKTTDKEYVPNGKLVYGHCPVCGTFTNNCKAYCNKCGQALDWSDRE